jgi:hypothetical protein
MSTASEDESSELLTATRDVIFPNFVAGALHMMLGAHPSQHTSSRYERLCRGDSEQNIENGCEKEWLEEVAGLR